MANSTVQLESGTQPLRRVLVADFAVVKFNTLIQWLRKESVVSETVTDPVKLVERVTMESFDVCIVNLLLGGTGPFEMISKIKSSSRNKDIKIVVVSRQVHKLNIQNTIVAGAHDFVAEPFENENLLHRVLYHLAPKKVIEPTGYEHAAPAKGKKSGEHWEYINLLLECAELLSKTERNKEHGTFLKILQGLAQLLSSNRSSLIIVEEETNTGVVLASSDDANFYDFPIALHKYPEILHVLHTGNFVLVEDVSQSALTNAIKEKVKSIQIGSLMVFPIRFQNEVMGVLTVRRAKAIELPSMDVMRILQAIANTMAAHSNVKALLRRIYKEYQIKAG